MDCVCRVYLCVKAASVTLRAALQEGCIASAERPRCAVLRVYMPRVTRRQTVLRCVHVHHEQCDFITIFNVVEYLLWGC